MNLPTASQYTIAITQGKHCVLMVNTSLVDLFKIYLDQLRQGKVGTPVVLMGSTSIDRKTYNNVIIDTYPREGGDYRIGHAKHKFDPITKQFRVDLKLAKA